MKKYAHIESCKLLAAIAGQDTGTLQCVSQWLFWLPLSAYANRKYKSTKTRSSYKWATWRYFNVISGHSFPAHPIYFHLCRQRPTMQNTIRCKPEVETIPQTGSTNILATETNLDAISLAIPSFMRGGSLSLVYMPTTPDASFMQKFQDDGRETITTWS